MEQLAYTAQQRNLGTQWGKSSLASRASEADVLLGAYADKFRKEGWDAAIAECKQELDAKDREIAELKEKLSMMQGFSTTTSTTLNVLPSREYEYNAACFSKPNAEIIFEVLIELTQSKREGDKYIICNKTDWYMVWKVLRYFNLYIGNEYDFINVVNECVLHFISDIKRKQMLSVSNNNFKSIKSDNPMKKFPVDKWQNQLEKHKDQYSSKSSQHGTFVLDRGINILVKLQKLLKSREINSSYYFK